jgi:hypothetical protein
MSPLARIRQVAACTALICFSGPGLADPPVPPAPPAHAPQPAPAAQPVRLIPDATLQIAHSALLSVDGTATGDTLRLTVRRVGDKAPVGSDDVTVTVDGRSEFVTRGAEGVYEVPVNDLRGGEPARDIEVIVAHDGIREILAGKAILEENRSAGSLLSDHKQVAWWLLNIAIVLVAAIALSRRKG